MKQCKSCYYQEIHPFLGRICQHKRSMDGTEAEAEYDICNEVEECEYYLPYKEAEDTYQITRITDKEGKDRKDGRYPQRIGRLCKRPVNVRGCAWIQYLENADGSDYAGKILNTSLVEKWEEDEESLVIETKNSIYYFGRCKNKGQFAK